MRPQHAQAALEFLTTYGWAFLVILIMVAAMSYFGVFNPQGLLPDKCIFGPGIGCRDFSVQGAAFHLVIKNNFGSDVYVQGINFLSQNGDSTANMSFCGQNTSLTITDSVYSGAVTNALWPSDDIADLRFGGCPVLVGERFAATVQVVVMLPGKSYPRTVQGELSLYRKN